MSRVAIITGVAGGIGRATAATFTIAGWRVIGIDRVAQPDGIAADTYEQLDLTLPDAAEQLRKLFSSVGEIDTVVNNAGIHVWKSIVDTTDADWAAVIGTNAWIPFVAIREAVPYLRATAGSIVNVSSVHAIATSTQVAAYAASKGALVALTRAAALELGPDGVRVNAVLPGAIDTPMLRDAANARLRGVVDAGDPLEGLAHRTPLGRIGKPEEIASVILFLADNDRSSFITGQTVIADGGVTARLASE